LTDLAPSVTIRTVSRRIGTLATVSGGALLVIGVEIHAGTLSVVVGTLGIVAILAGAAVGLLSLRHEDATPDVSASAVGGPSTTGVDSGAPSPGHHHAGHGGFGAPVGHGGGGHHG
jgi:hypothetical protein